MKILHVVGIGKLPQHPESEPTQGVARVALEIARAQVRENREIEVVALDDHNWHRSWHGVRVTGIRIARWARLHWRQRTYDLRAWVPLAIYTRRQRFDVVHVHGLDRFRPVAGQVRVAHFHNDPLWSSDSDALAAQAPEFRRIARDTDAQIAVSRYVAERLEVGLRHAEAADRLRMNIHLVPNGVDFDQYSPDRLNPSRERLRADWGVRPNDVVFLFSGAIVPAKGVEYLARAFADLQNTSPSVRLVLAGGARLWEGVVQDDHCEADEYENRVSTLLAEARHKGVVRLLGMVPGPAMPAVYAAADVVVAPSVVPEAFGLSILEGMAAGKAVVACRVGGVPELVDGKNGLLVEPRNAAQLLAAMQCLVENHELRMRLQLRAVATASRYTWHAAVRELDTLYRQLLH